jgi:hypothetical protein
MENKEFSTDVRDSGNRKSYCPVRTSITDNEICHTFSDRDGINHEVVIEVFEGYLNVYHYPNADDESVEPTHLLEIVAQIKEKSNE